MHYTLKELAALMNIAPAEDLYCEIFPISEHVFVYRFANRERPLMAYHLMNLLHDFPDGAICLWEGEIEDIPNEWYLCDGNNGTPDLRDRFPIGAGHDYAVGDTGGGGTHNHNFTGDGHIHSFMGGPRIQPGSTIHINFKHSHATGTTDNKSPTLRYRSFAYIMFNAD